MIKGFARLALLCGMVFAVQACGGSEKTSATPQATISAPAAVNERSMTALTAQPQGSAPISNYKWEIAAAGGASVSLTGETSATATLVIGELGDAGSVTVKLTVTGSDGTSSSAEQRIELRELDRAALPPMPSVSDSKAAIPGIDSDGNSVRDDVEHSIYNLYPLDGPRRTILLIGARALQMEVMAGVARDQARGDAASEQSARFAACIVALDPDGAEREQAALLAFTVNTAEREQAYSAYMLSRNGTIQRAIEVQTDTCRF